jgi:hypothetical protein
VAPAPCDLPGPPVRSGSEGPLSHPVFGASLARFKAEVEKLSKGAIAVEIQHGERARKLMDAYGRLRLDRCCSAGPGDTATFTRR